MKPYLDLFARGLLIVMAVSFQTVSLARGDMVRVGVGAFIIGCLWFLNAKQAAQSAEYGWLAYAAGSSIGAMAGMWLAG